MDLNYDKCVKNVKPILLTSSQMLHVGNIYIYMSPCFCGHFFIQRRENIPDIWTIGALI